MLALAISMAMTNCSNDYSPEVLGTTNVAINPLPESTSAKDVSSKTDVKRGNIYAWVKEINLSATSTSTNYSVSETFNLVDNGTGGATSNFILKDVQEGENLFKATTTTGSIPTLSHTPVANAHNKSQVLKPFVDKNPYALYYSPDVVENINLHNPNFINIPMNTDFGRRISLFRLGDNFSKTYYYAEVATYKNGTAMYMSEVRGDRGVVSYWSDDDSTNGNKIVHVIKVRRTSNSSIVKTFTIEENITSSVSNSCAYTVVSKNQVLKEEQRFKFEWQRWVETGCDTGDCDDNEDD